MTARLPRSAYMQGLRDGAPFLLVLIPFSSLFGMVAGQAGLDLAQIMGFSVLVIAGAAQFAALQMMVQHASIPLILLAALAVNLRMAMYSAALVPHLGSAPLWQRALVAYVNFDQTYAVSLAHYEANPRLSVAEKVAFFLGVATPITPAWVAMTALGAMAGAAVPDWLALDFALPITFLGLLAPMLRSLAHVAAAATSVIVALLLAGLPAGLGLLVAAACAMVAGAGVETWMEGRRP
ncbi:MAG: branched-chain amino acid ABC transporter permease [Limimaricola sp.]|uniref:AzlC family ABC transporter permease n=1 Tax=Limimaricola sp. TaxID=2211665 RepID=UPI001D41650A|nr:AzlC family ABC transporter permease [Limimaricola sp.]MBI1417385.1 branched-chain amino acid ABC transporter permease [Limimaricola sp.]